MLPASFQKLSDYLVALVQVVFAVVVAQSLETFRSVLIDPFANGHSVAAFALTTVYVLTVLSWIDWHRTMVLSPYNLSFYNDARRWEEARLGVDVLIVVTYAYLLFSVEPFVDEPDADIGRHLLGYPLVYLLYLASGWTRRQSYGKAASHYPSILGFLAVMTTLVAGYWIAADLYGHPAWFNFCAIGAVLVSTIAYRYLRRRWTASRSRRKRRGLRIGFDLDGVLGDQISGVLPRIKARYGVDLSYDDITHWRLPIKNTDIANEIEEALKDPSYVLRMLPHPGAEDVLSELIPENRILVVTARSSEAQELSIQWLRNKRLPFDEVVSAQEAMKSLHGADVLVDDYLGNVIEFLENSPGTAILMDQPWNQEREKLQPWIDRGRAYVVRSLSEVPSVVEAVMRPTR